RDVHINTAWAFVLKLFNWLKILRCLFQLLGNLLGCDGSVLFLILAPVSTVLIQQFPYCPCHFNVPPLCFEVFSAMYRRTQAFRLNRKQHTADSFCSYSYHTTHTALFSLLVEVLFQSFFRSFYFTL